jgi:hypothetical protein
MNRLSIIVFLNLIFNFVFTQESRLETEKFLYWQTDTRLQFSDYQRSADSSDIAEMNKYDTKSLANIQIHSILDYPKKARKIKTLKEQWYLTPAFCKKCSPLIMQDSIELLQDQVFFDIAEYCTRATRIRIAELEKQNYGNSFIGAAFPGLIDKMYEMMREMFGSFGRAVIIEKKPGAYEEWRKSIDEMLEETKDYATRSIDCQRFINDKPFSDEYKVSYAVYGKDI